MADLATPAAAEQLAAWFTSRWGQRAPATSNRNLDALRAAIGYWHNQGWLDHTADPTRSLRRRSRAPDRTKALPGDQIKALLTREDLGLRERTLWRMLYETAACASEILALDVTDLDLRNRSAKVRRKAGASDVIVWQTATARLLPRLLRGRTAGPVFCTNRRARVQLPAGDLDPATGRARLSYRRAAELFEQATTGCPGGPWTLHQLRHFALTHAAEASANTATLLAYSGHTSVASWPATLASPPRHWPAGSSSATPPDVDADNAAPGRSHRHQPKPTLRWAPCGSGRAQQQAAVTARETVRLAGCANP